MTDREEAAARRSEAKQIKRRLTVARKGLFPMKTCPASRHTHLIVEGLLDPKSDMHRSLGGFEPEHIAASIASVLEGLWQARRWMKWEGGIRGRWVPDFDALEQFRTDRKDGDE